MDGVASHFRHTTPTNSSIYSPFLLPTSFVVRLESLLVLIDLLLAGPVILLCFMFPCLSSRAIFCSDTIRENGAEMVMTTYCFHHVSLLTCLVRVHASHAKEFRSCSSEGSPSGVDPLTQNYYLCQMALKYLLARSY